MSSLNTSERFSYKLPLDDLDLCQLGHPVNDCDYQKAGIWTKEKLEGESKYYEIEIVPQENYDESFVPSETFNCHICDTDVPISCTQEHNISKKHKTYERLFAIVLARVSKQINGTINNKEYKTSMPENTYYCENCCKLIDIKNRRKHILSDHHEKSIENDAALTNITNIFEMDKNRDVKPNLSENKLTTNDNSEEDVKPNLSENKLTTNDNSEEAVKPNLSENKLTTNYNSEEDVKANLSENKLTTNDNSEVTSDAEDESSDTEWTYSDSDDDLTRDGKHILNIRQLHSYEYEYDDSEEESQHLKSSNENLSVTSERQKRNTQPGENLQFYIKKYLEKHKLPIKLPAINNFTVNVENNKGEKLKMALDNYLSYRDIDDKQYCQMCKAWVEDRQAHDRSDDHLKKILIPIDEQFARNIDETFSHCLICNDIIMTLSHHHLLNEDHKNIKNNMRIREDGNDDKLRYGFYKMYPTGRTQLNGCESSAIIPFKELKNIVYTICSACTSLFNYNSYGQALLQSMSQAHIYPNTPDFRHQMHTNEPPYKPSPIGPNGCFPFNSCGPAMQSYGPSPMHVSGPLGMHPNGPIPMRANGPTPMHHNGPNPMHPNGPIPMHPNGPTPMHPNGPITMHPNGPTPMHPNGPTPMHPNGPTPIHNNGFTPMHPNGLFPMQPNGIFPMYPYGPIMQYNGPMQHAGPIMHHNGLSPMRPNKPSAASAYGAPMPSYGPTVMHSSESAMRLTGPPLQAKLSAGRPEPPQRLNESTPKDLDKSAEDSNWPPLIGTNGTAGNKTSTPSKPSTTEHTTPDSDGPTTPSSSKHATPPLRQSESSILQFCIPGVTDEVSGTHTYASVARVSGTRKMSLD